jgi:hypothetical protein
MAPRKGTVNNPAGRPAGSPNKSTDQLRNVFQAFLETNLETVQNDFDSLEARDRLIFILKIANLVLPSLPTAIKVEKEFRPFTGITFCDCDCDCEKHGPGKIQN